MRQYNLLRRKMLTPVMVFGVVVFAALVLSVGFTAFHREQSAIEEDISSRMKVLMLDLDTKIMSSQAVLLSESHSGNFDLSDTASVFRKLRNIVTDDNFIVNSCLEVWDVAFEGNPDCLNEFFYVGRSGDGRVQSKHTFMRDSEENPDDMASYYDALRTGGVSWSHPYYDTLFCNSHVLTCYKKCEDPGMALSMDLELSSLLENIDSLRLYKGSTMCVRTARGEAYTRFGDDLLRVDNADYDPEHNVLLTAHYPTLDIDIIGVVPKNQIYNYMWGWVSIVFSALILFLITLSILVHRAFIGMEMSLTETVRKSTREEMELKKIEGDLALAAHLQTRMLASPGEGVHLAPEGAHSADIMSRIIPAREVGGDLYEYSLVGDNLVMCIADVSGKGLPASVVMTMCCTLFHAYLSDNPDPEPSSLLSYLNVQLCRRNEDNMFATAWVGVLNLRLGTLKYASAGHNPAVLISSAGANFIRTKPGAPLGLFDDMVFPSSACTLSEGDSILLYTDGITEAEDSSHLLFGEQNLLEVCTGAISHSPQVICSTVLSAVQDHVRGAVQSDDITLLCVTFGGRFAQLHSIDDVMALHTLSEESGGSYRTALALEELAVNAFTYGGASFVSASEQDGVYCLVDDGQEFDPTAYEPSSSQDDDLTVGGRGISLVRKMSSLFTWHRSGRFNVTTLKINEI